MSEHKITLNWQKTSDSFSYKEYNREHTWTFKNGLNVEASAATGYLGSPDCVDPEEVFVASLSSCHMLTFLAIASMQRFDIASYVDEAVGIMAKNTEGKMAITEVTLKPQIEFVGDNRPTAEQIAQMHHKAHEQCFIANSVKTEIKVEA